MKNRSRWVRTAEIDILEKMNKKLMCFEVRCAMELLDMYQEDSKCIKRTLKEVRDALKITAVTKTVTSVFQSG